MTRSHAEIRNLLLSIQGDLTYHLEMGRELGEDRLADLDGEALAGLARAIKAVDIWVREPDPRMAARAPEAGQDGSIQPEAP